MNVIDPAFGSADMESATVQFNLIPPQGPTADTPRSFEAP
jgi:hypothetical protein